MIDDKTEGELLFLQIWKSVCIFEKQSEQASEQAKVYTCVCVWLCSPRHACAWAVPRPGLEGLSEISCKRITDHASLAYRFTAKNTYTYTQNLLLSCNFLSVCLSPVILFRHTVSPTSCTYTHITPLSMGSLGVQGVWGRSLHRENVCFYYSWDKQEQKISTVAFAFWELKLRYITLKKYKFILANTRTGVSCWMVIVSLFPYLTKTLIAFCSKSDCCDVEPQMGQVFFKKKSMETKQGAWGMLHSQVCSQIKKIQLMPMIKHKPYIW